MNIASAFSHIDKFRCESVKTSPLIKLYQSFIKDARDDLYRDVYVF